MATGTRSSLLPFFRKIALTGEAGSVPDRQLLECFVVHREEAAFRALLRKHESMVMGVCRRVLRNTHDAEDAFQATFLVFVRKAATIRHGESLANWLYGVAYRTARKALVSRARAAARQRRIQDRQVRDMPIQEQSDDERWHELQPLLDQELSRLPDKYRVPIVLCDLEGKTRKQSARELRCSEGTISSRLSRGRQMLAKRLRRWGVTLSAGALAAVLSHSVGAGAVPTVLTENVTTSALLVAAGKAATTTVVSSKVAALTEGVIKAMLLSKLKIATAIIVVSGLVVGSGSVVTSRALKAGQPEVRQESKPALRIASQPNPKPKPRPPTRAEQLKAIQEEHRVAQDELIKAIRAGKLKKRTDGGYDEIGELQNRFGERLREFIAADPKDEAAFDAIVFCRGPLAQWDPKLTELLATHHSARPTLGQYLSIKTAEDEKFVKIIAAKTPHSGVRARANLALATEMARHDRVPEAELLLEKIMQDKHDGAALKAAEALLFEIQHLAVGKPVPEIDELDMDGKPMKLSEYRGKVVLLVFWATWCGPCMAMVPHERELVKRYADKPFALVGVNGDFLGIALGPNAKLINDGPKVRKIMEREGITWRSFEDDMRDPVTKKLKENTLSRRWNIYSWPTVFIIDHQGIIRHKFIGLPENAALDAAIEKLVVAAEAELKKKDKK